MNVLGAFPLRAAPLRDAAAALLWQFAWRHRWGFAATGLYFVALITARLFFLQYPPGTTPLESIEFAFTVNVPLTCAFIYLLAIFSFGLEGDLGQRPSLYPSRMFTLPISTTALAAWPMLFGALSMAVLWVLTVLLALRPVGLDFPVLWPALFAASFIAWIQVFMWLPFGLRNLRVILAVLMMFLIDTVVIVAVYAKIPHAVMALFIAPALPAAFLAGRFAVARARRGEVPDWSSGRDARHARHAAPFRTASSAQLWFEWKRHGRSLPMLVAIVVPFQLALLFTPGGTTAGAVFESLTLVIITPPLMAIFAAATVRKMSDGDAHGLGPFLATRPMASATMVAATLKVALLSTLLAWSIVFLLIPLALTLSGTWVVFMGGVRNFMTAVQPWHAVLLTIVVLAGLIGSTWKQLVQSLCIGFTGSERLIKGSVFGTLVLLVAAILLYTWISESTAAQDALWLATPWIIVALVVLKMAIALRLSARLQDSGVISDSALLTGALIWLAAVLLIYAALSWAVDTPHIARYFLALIAILLTPLNRVSAAPLALDWNRHRGRVGRIGRVGRVGLVVVVLLMPLLLAGFQAYSFYVAKGPTGRMISSGEERDYVLYVPASYDAGKPTPLVISMHGAGLWGYAQLEISRWNEVADRHGFLVVYPSGWKHAGPRIWRVFPDQVKKDVRFIAQLIDTIAAKYTIDPARVYADGLSNGGGMAFALSCELHDRIAAVGLVAAAQTMPWGDCLKQKPVPVIAIHGTADNAAPYHGRTSWVSERRPFPNMPNFMATWAERNRCAPKPTEARVAADITLRAYVGCARSADVHFYTVEDGGHTWPGGGHMPYWMAGRMSNSISASGTMWKFFMDHPLKD